MRPVGIDLGTTNSLIAVFEEGGPRLIPNALGRVLTPSAVSIDKKGNLLVGQAARDRLVTHPDRTAAYFKRRMGTDHEYRLAGKHLKAEDLSALVLRQLKADAEADLGEEVRDVVVSVPAYFNEPQRKATVTACAIAGLNAIRLVNEPTAAALAYGLHDRDGESTFMVVDLGGGTFDVSVLEMFEGVMEVRASAGDAYLGGEDFSDRLAKHVAERFELDWIRAGAERQSAIRSVADEAKRRLSATQETEVTVPGEARAITVSRDTFREINADLLNRLLRPIERCLYDTRLEPHDLDRVVLVGGATRMPEVRQLVGRQLRCLPEAGIDPDHAVALGAAVQAGLAARDAALEDVVMTDVSAFTLGIETAQQLSEHNFAPGFFMPIIERNTPVPVSREETVHTLVDNQKRLRISVYQGEAPKVIDNIALGNFDVAVPKAPAGQEAVRVRFTYDVSGLLEVEATVISTGVTESLVIRKLAANMSEDEIARRVTALQSLKQHPREDAANQALIARLDRVYALALRDDRDFVQRLIVRFEAALATQDTEAIGKERGEISEILDRIDDHYVS